MKILHFIYGMDIGGAETFIENLMRCVEMDEHHIDFVLQSRNNSNKRLLQLCMDKGSTILELSRSHVLPLDQEGIFSIPINPSQEGPEPSHFQVFKDRTLCKCIIICSLEKYLYG